MTWRSILLGLVGVCFICGLTPYNDYVLANTYLVGNFMPVGLMLFFLLFVLVINGPMHRWRPRWSLSARELSIAMAMMLVSCTLPSSGLMRYLPGQLVGLPALASTEPGAAALLQEIDLPNWMFPRASDGTGVVSGADPVVTNFLGRTPGEAGLVGNVPWESWLRPAVSWGLLLVALYGAILCLSVVVRRQWQENERLPFPLATIYSSLVETPSPGRLLNRTLGDPRFWIAFVAILAFHFIGGLHRYFPARVPQLPRGFDLSGMMAEAPLSYADHWFKVQNISFLVIGVMFFLQSKVVLSLWLAYVLLQTFKVVGGSGSVEVSQGMQIDQLFGGTVAYAAAILWIGRRQWWSAVRGIGDLGRKRTSIPQGDRDESWAIIGLLVFLGGVVMWLIAAGASVVGAILLTLMVVLLLLVLARIVAETGMPFAQLNLPLNRPWVYLFGTGITTTPKSFFLGNMFTGLFTHDMRESLSVYGTHATVIVANQHDGAPARRSGVWRALPTLLTLALALGVGYVVAGASMLASEYSFAATLTPTPTAPLNGYGTQGVPKTYSVDPTMPYLTERGPVEPHNRIAHFGAGSVTVATLAALRMRFTAWPLHPVGFLMAYSYPLASIWFSVFLGWLLKVLIVQFGGGSLFLAMRPLAIGLILGEAASSALWLVVSFVLASMGQDYQPVFLLPG